MMYSKKFAATIMLLFISLFVSCELDKALADKVKDKVDEPTKFTGEELDTDPVANPLKKKVKDVVDDNVEKVVPVKDKVVKDTKDKVKEVVVPKAKEKVKNEVPVKEKVTEKVETKTQTTTPKADSVQEKQQSEYTPTTQAKTETETKVEDAKEQPKSEPEVKDESKEPIIEPKTAAQVDEEITKELTIRDIFKPGTKWMTRLNPREESVIIVESEDTYSEEVTLFIGNNKLGPTKTTYNYKFSDDGKQLWSKNPDLLSSKGDFYDVEVVDRTEYVVKGKDGDTVKRPDVTWKRVGRN